MVSVGVSVPLQLDPASRQDRELAARLALVREAEARYEDMLRSHEAEVRGLLNDWQNGKERVARFREQIVPAARQRAQALQTAYRTGKADLAAALSARRDEIDAAIQALAVEQETARSWAQLNYLTPDTSSNTSRQEQP
jgi:outer membrane protein TolC